MKSDFSINDRLGFHVLMTPGFFLMLVLQMFIYFFHFFYDFLLHSWLRQGVVHAVPNKNHKTRALDADLSRCMCEFGK